MMKLIPPGTEFCIIENDLPTEIGIERWREWCKAESRPESHAFLDAMFDAAILGLKAKIDIRAEAKTAAARMFRSMADQMESDLPKASVK